MRISEIARRQPLEHRHVGIRTDHIYVVETAIRVYTATGLDPVVEYDQLYLDLPKAQAAWAMGAIERASGRVAFNEWENA